MESSKSLLLFFVEQNTESPLKKISISLGNNYERCSSLEIHRSDWSLAMEGILQSLRILTDIDKDNVELCICIDWTIHFCFFRENAKTSILESIINFFTSARELVSPKPRESAFAPPVLLDSDFTESVLSERWLKQKNIHNVRVFMVLTLPAAGSKLKARKCVDVVKARLGEMLKSLNVFNVSRDPKISDGLFSELYAGDSECSVHNGKSENLGPMIIGQFMRYYHLRKIQVSGIPCDDGPTKSGNKRFATIVVNTPTGNDIIANDSAEDNNEKKIKLKVIDEPSAKILKELYSRDYSVFTTLRRGNVASSFLTDYLNNGGTLYLANEGSHSTDTPSHALVKLAGVFCIQFLETNKNVTKSLKGVGKQTGDMYAGGYHYNDFEVFMRMFLLVPQRAGAKPKTNSHFTQTKCPIDNLLLASVFFAPSFQTLSPRLNFDKVTRLISKALKPSFSDADYVACVDLVADLVNLEEYRWSHGRGVPKKSNSNYETDSQNRISNTALHRFAIECAGFRSHFHHSLYGMIMRKLAEAGNFGDERPRAAAKCSKRLSRLMVANHTTPENSAEQSWRYPLLKTIADYEGTSLSLFDIWACHSEKSSTDYVLSPLFGSVNEKYKLYQGIKFSAISDVCNEAFDL